MKQKLTIYFLLTVFLSACGQSNTKSENQNQGIIMAEQTKISGLENTLERLMKGELEYDFFGLTSNGTDCLYFVYENNSFNIEYEVMTESQKPYFQKLKQYCSENEIRVIETTYQNQPQYNDTKYAPVLRLEINSTLEQADKLGRTLMSTIFNNDNDTQYDIVP
jgi:hypothetical protein